MTYSLIISLFISATALWDTPAADVLHTELAPFLKEGEVLSAHDSTGTARFEEAIEVLRRSSIPIKNYLDQCDKIAWQELPFAEPILLPQTPLDVHVGEGQTNYLFGSLRYYLALRLVQARLFDEAKKVLDDLTPENSIDPAGVLIIKALVFYHLSEKEEGQVALKDFQEIAKRENVSRRSAELAKLLQFEWERQTKEEETEKISRQMNDIRRRLGLGRTDDGTQDAERDALKSLDKLIEQLEQQRQRQRARGNEGQQSNNPAEESERLKQKGPGNVDRRDFAQGDNWGNLSPKDRDEALLKIEKEFPAYYRDIIEQFFREMAK
ncbi:MAG: hypothetical protein LBI05_05130 [Planctomycetaceae bacterium]|nr:hypothetical protein [Planctomycetaceae bacterium]